MTELDDRLQLRKLLVGFQATQAIHVAANIGLADQVTEDGKRIDELAVRTGCDPASLLRLALALAALGLVRLIDGDRLTLTRMGRLLRRDVEGTQAYRAMLMGRPYFWKAWGALSHSVATGSTAFNEVHGVDGWTWRNSHPEDGALFDAAMAADAEWMAQAIIDAYDFSSFRHVVDVGGGDGSFLAALARSFPALHGTVIEQPRVAEEARGTFAKQQIADRLSVVGGNFFDPLPAGGDGYLLKWVTHNWSDFDCRRLLSNIRKAIHGSGRLLVIEYIIDADKPDLSASLMDLNMLVMNGGHERTTAEFSLLLHETGYQTGRILTTSSGLGIVEAIPA